ncbi:MAG TPA: nuclease, partial [Mycobacterium sp.]|nr:nuclease [Mycobacterium sp.]
MFVLDDQVVYSATDLSCAAECEYALLRTFDAKLGRGPALSADPLTMHLAMLGRRHEYCQLDRLRDEFGGAVTVIGRPAYTRAGLASATEATLRAVAGGAPVVYQAAAFDGRFVGFADFLVRDGSCYRVRDAKLARSAKSGALLQVTAYAQTLSHAGVPIAPEVELILGDGSLVSHRTDEQIPIYASRRARVQQLLDDHLARGAAVSWDDPGVQACLRCELCWEWLRAGDDVLLVKGMRVDRRATLFDAGIHTVTDLAEHRGPVPNLAQDTLDTLTAQAKLQVRQRNTGIPQFEIVNPAQLALLPEPDDGDLFFDFEGDTQWAGADGELGLEYLFGILDSAGGFRPLWAHDRADERRALIDFLALVRDQRNRYPAMHIYHYAAYE